MIRHWSGLLLFLFVHQVVEAHHGSHGDHHQHEDHGEVKGHGDHHKHGDHGDLKGHEKHHCTKGRHDNKGADLISNLENSADDRNSVNPKFISISTWPIQLQKSKPTALYVFNTERYKDWSEWSECLLRDCIQVRYRECVDDSWKQNIEDKTRAVECLSKFYAEKRTCSDTSNCHRNVGQRLFNQWQETCGQRPPGSKYRAKILGGNVARPHSWPWAVRLSVKSRRGKSISFCGGTLVAPHLIVTAAHCLLSLNSRMPPGKLFKLSDYTPHKLYAHIGDHHRKVTEDSQLDLPVNLAIIHPQYHRVSLTDGYDFALVYLSQPVNASEEVNFACLPPKNTVLQPGTKCVSVGWGHNKKGETPDVMSLQNILDALLRPRPFWNPFGRPSWNWPKRGSNKKHPDAMGTLELHEVDLPIISNEKCLKHFVELNPKLHICAGSEGKDTCSGDSGGGLYCKIPDSDQWMLAGVTSYGVALGCGHNPGVYTSTASHLEWTINNLMDPEK